MTYAKLRKLRGLAKSHAGHGRSVILCRGYASGEFTVIDDAGPGEDTGSVDLDAFGGVVGGGAAFAISDNASLRLEGLHYIFEEEKDTSDLTSDSDDGDSLSLEDVFVIRAGLDWCF